MIFENKVYKEIGHLKCSCGNVIEFDCKDVPEEREYPPKLAIKVMCPKCNNVYDITDCTKKSLGVKLVAVDELKQIR